MAEIKTERTNATAATPPSDSPPATAVSSDDKRDILRQRIEAGERRNEERSLGDYAKDASETVTDFVKEHPLTAVGAVAGVALLIGLASRPGRRAASRAGSAVSSAAGTSALAGSGLLSSLFESARHGGDWLEERGADVSRNARSARRRAAFESAEAQDSLGSLVRRAGRKTSRTFRDLKYRGR